MQTGFAFLVPAYLGSPGKRALNGCVCVCVCGYCSSKHVTERQGLSVSKHFSTVGHCKVQYINEMNITPMDNITAASKNYECKLQ